MRMSCNGCRVLRKGCSENCSIRPCLQLFKSPESQANATVFLAKFYGRAGLLNLINAGPDDLRPAIFRSLLYEACGRIVNPIYGSAGLLCSGSWNLCQAAVDAVLKGAPIAQISSETAAAAASTPPPTPLKPYDIRHVSKDPVPARAAVAEIHRVSMPRPRFKRSAAKSVRPGFQRELSHESFGSHESAFSADTAEASHVSQGEPHAGSLEDGEVELELSLGLEPAGSGGRPDRGPVEKQRFAVNQLGFGLELHA